jgi:hypothetical protein
MFDWPASRKRWKSAREGSAKAAESAARERGASAAKQSRRGRIFMGSVR